MTEFPNLLWARLTEKQREALVKVAEELAQGYSGDITLACNKGGVRLIRFGTEWRPGDGTREYIMGEGSG